MITNIKEEVKLKGAKREVNKESERVIKITCKHTSKMSYNLVEQLERSKERQREKKRIKYYFLLVFFKNCLILLTFKKDLFYWPKYLLKRFVDKNILLPVRSPTRSVIDLVSQQITCRMTNFSAVNKSHVLKINSFLHAFEPTDTVLSQSVTVFSQDDIFFYFA